MLPMLGDLRLRYRTVLVKISQDLTEGEMKELLFFSKDHIPKSLSCNSTAGVQIFGPLEDRRVISWEKLDYLMEFADAINRQDFVAQLTAFELTRELVFYALKKHGSQLVKKLSNDSVGLQLAEIVDLVHDRVDVSAQGLIKSLLKPPKRASDVLDFICQKVLPDAYVTKPNTLALLVAIAAEIVLLVFDESQQENRKRYAVDVAIELADHLLTKMASFDIWKDFCRYVGERHHDHFSEPVPEPAPEPWQLRLVTDLISKMRETFCSY